LPLRRSPNGFHPPQFRQQTTFRLRRSDR
jgi:hypothetical protein